MKRSALTNIILLVVAVLVGWWVLRAAVSILYSLLPVLLIAGVVYVAYKMTSQKSLGGGDRSRLP